MTTETLERLRLEPPTISKIEGHFHRFQNCTRCYPVKLNPADISEIKLMAGRNVHVHPQKDIKSVKLARPDIHALRGLWYLMANTSVDIDGVPHDNTDNRPLFDNETMRRYGVFYAMFQNDPQCLRFEHIDPKFW